ncbi:hypothetical protein MXD95_013340 [Frankia sp. AiPa1]|nr:hypothetical protein [Frankia sp. AiPa1]
MHPDEVAVIRGGARTAAAFADLPFDHLIFTGSPEVGALVADYTTVPGYRRNFLRMGFDEAAITDRSDAFVDGVTVWGGLESIVARVAEYHAAGADQVVLALHLPTDAGPGEEAAWQARLAEALLP